MMPTASLDTNCILRWLLSDDPAQTELVSKLIDSGQELMLEDAAVIECVFVMEKIKKISRPSIAKAVNTILSQTNIKCGRKIFSDALPVYTTHPKLSFVDCYLAIAAQEKGVAPLYTFDKKLANQMPGVALIQ